MKLTSYGIMAGTILTLAVTDTGWATGEKVDTAVYARIGNDYDRKQLKDGTFKPEFYALSNGGRIEGTGRDSTVDRVTYPQVAEIATRLLAGQNYHYAQSENQAKLLLVLHWGSTIGFDRINYGNAVNSAAHAMANLKAAINVAEQLAMRDALEGELLKLKMANQARDEVNTHNAKVIGYLDEMVESGDIRIWAGGGDRFRDLVADIEESRYYIVISAYDFPELRKNDKRKLLWQVRVSVRTPGNSFDDSMAAMLKSASKYFGQDSGRLIRSEESKGTVELGDMKILGEAQESKELTNGKKRP